jgi:pyruvate,water dikinase
MERALIVYAKDVAACTTWQLGGKAAQLAWLVRQGYTIPDFYVITTLAWEKQEAYLGIDSWLHENLSAMTTDDIRSKRLEEFSAQVKEKMVASLLVPELDKALDEAYSYGAIGKEDYVAVRSSIVGEDGKKDSFAGQMESFLFCRGKEQIAAAIKKCWASAFSQRAIAYRLQKGLPVTSISAAVIVQKMIEGSVSGVLFTAHPVNGSRHQALLTATYGLGEGLVSGLCNADEFTYDYHADSIVEKKLPNKDSQVVLDSRKGYGTMQVPVKETDCLRSCLTDAQATQIITKGRQIAGMAGCPQDIEWTLSGEQLFFLQTRPITHLPPPTYPTDKPTVWDNSNIQESYCGVTTPLTFSFASHAYATVYEQTMRLMGIPEKVIAAHKDMLQNLLGLVKGRIYYNINNWYRGLLLLPSFRQNKADMERMMGLQDPVDFVESRTLSLIEKLKKLPVLVETYARLLARFRKLPGLVDEFSRMFEAEYSKVNRATLQECTIAELIQMSEKLEESLLKRWQTPIINDFSVMMANGKVRRWLEKTGLPHISALQNNLLIGEEGMVSTEPTKKLMDLAKEVRKDEKLLSLLGQYTDARVLPAIQVHAPQFYQQCIAYIEQYGDRCIGELKLESVTLRQDASFMFSVIRNYLGRQELDAAKLHTREKALRAEAEKEVFEAIRQKHGRYALQKFKKDLQGFRQGVKNRENMRMARTRMFGLFRDIYLETGRQLAFYGVIEEARDIFYLTIAELKQYRDGRCVNAQFKAIVGARKAEFTAYEQEEIPHHFITYGAVYAQPSYTYPYQNTVSHQTHQGQELTGIGCYPGLVEGQVKLIFSPKDELSLNGHILCTVRTDPGWTPLFPTCSGIIVERGSTLSHSAVVARELGIPAIVGVKDVTRLLKTGDHILMDGSKGTIKQLIYEQANT